MTSALPDLWVFAYGSLMWNPGFDFEEVVPARLTGWHRRFCITSRIHRGTHHRPGLVLGLDRGGVTDGLAYRVAGSKAIAVRNYLRAREQPSGIYREAHVKLSLRGRPEGCYALVYLAETSHPGFTPRVPVPRQALIIAGARGHAGTNIDYLANTLRELRRLGIRERELERIQTCLGPIRSRYSKAMLSHRYLHRWPENPALKPGDIARFPHRARVG